MLFVILSIGLSHNIISDVLVGIVKGTNKTPPKVVLRRERSLSSHGQNFERFRSFYSMIVVPANRILMVQHINTELQMKI